jgi:hypothetical protein
MQHAVGRFFQEDRHGCDAAVARAEVAYLLLRSSAGSGGRTRGGGLHGDPDPVSSDGLC